MAADYLVSSLQPLALEGPAPYTAGHFLDLCRSQLSAGDADGVAAVMGGASSGHPLAARWRDIDAHYITITDNGTGFDVSKLENAESSHIGIRNVRERIEKMCGGTFDIASEIGKGTSVTVKIPIEGGTL